MAWQKQKGYDVLVESRASWDSLTIKSMVKEFYDQNDKPGYMLIVGDAEDVPGVMPAKSGSGDKEFMSDVNYVLVGSTFYMPEMAAGRISVSTVEEAWNVVNKILRYERDPIDNEGYYNSYLFCAQFQDSDNDGYADRRFAETAWEMYCYMGDSLGYNVEKIFSDGSHGNVGDPRNWNNKKYSFGKPIPQELRKPNFAWDGDSIDILDALNNGSGKHIVMHRDHGLEEGWGTPRFRNNNVQQVDNGQKNPIIFSLNCLTGTYRYNDCFAEEFIKQEDGALGVVAASRASWSGANDAYAHGLFDAIWSDPGTFMVSPENTDPQIEEHEPIYTIGDVMLHANIRMKECWSDLINFYKLFHWFGDPTMEVRTKNPQNITANHQNQLLLEAKALSVSGLNVSNGYITLYSKKSGDNIYKQKVYGSSANLTWTSNLETGDTLVLTVTSHDYRPYQKKIPVVAIININNNLVSMKNYFKIYLNGKKLFFVNLNKNVSLDIYSVNGRIVYNKFWDRVTKDIRIDIPEVSSGVYFVRMKSGGGVVFKDRVVISR